MDDAANGLSETATYCRKNDDKRPTLVGLPDNSTKVICPVDGSEVQDGVHDAYPQGWFVRIMFDELLDPSVEDLTEILDADGNPTGTYSGSIAGTHPVNLQCTGVSGAFVDVPYDGYYNAAGNNVTWPLGPSIVVKPKLPGTIPTNSNCRISINDTFHDKNDGVPVPVDERGPYTFSVGKIKVASLSPTDKDKVDGVDAGVDVIFNTLIDPTSEDPAVTWGFAPGAGLSDNPFSQGFVANGGLTNFIPMVGGKLVGANEYFIGVDFYAKTDYTWTIPQGTKLKDLCGVETTFVDAPAVADLTQVGFSVNDIMFTGITPTDGTMAASPGTKVQLKFNQYMDPASLAGHCSAGAMDPCFSDPDCVALAEGTCLSTKFSIMPPVTNMFVDADLADQSKLMIYGDFQIATDYTFTLNASTTITECPGAESFFGGTCGANPRTYLNADQQVVHFKTAPMIALTGITPADNAEITKVEPIGAQARTSITMTFNQEMDPTTFDQGTDYTIEPNIPLAASSSTTNILNVRLRPAVGTLCTTNPATDSSTCTGYPPGTYTFTLKKGASFDDLLGNHYVQPDDQVIHFTIHDPDPTPDCLP